MNIDVLVIGEALVDFVPTHRGALSDATGFELHSGGAPANVAVGAARLGAKSAFVGVVGDDPFGIFLKAALVREGVDVSRVRLTDGDQTGLCFITLDADGERSFLHRGGEASLLLRADDIDAEQVASAKVVQFSVGSLRRADGAAAIARLAEHATGLVCCDPGFCPPHWANPVVMHLRLKKALATCHVIKCSKEETGFILGIEDPHEAIGALLEYGAELAVVTLGPDGALWARANDRGHVPSPDVEVVDTTGAGDAFMAALLSRLAKDDRSPAHLSHAELVSHIEFACAIGAGAVTRRGAVTGIVRREPS